MAELRPCSRCGEAKPLEDFYWKDSSRRWRFTRCKACVNAASVAWRKANPERAREAQRVRDARVDPQVRLRYRIRRSAVECGQDPDAVEALYKSHDGLCDICGRTPDAAVQPKRRLSIDHNHATGAFRGLICHDCNLMLGFASDDPKRLLAAADYLERGTR